MVDEAVFRCSRNILLFFYAYFSAVARKFGMDEALKLNSKMNNFLGHIQGETLKKRPDAMIHDAKSAFDLITDITESIGIKMHLVEANSKRVLFRIFECPIYEAANLLQMEVKPLCKTGAIQFINTVIRELNPALVYQNIKFRSDSRDYCEEEIRLLV